MTKHLLPPNTTKLEKALAECAADIERINPELIKTLWNPDTCPPEFLPFLAWAYSVDKWSDDWTDQAKRQTIKNSYYIHSKKGTLSAIRRVVEPMGYLLEVKRWYEVEPNLPRGSFELEISIANHGIDETTFLELERLLNDARPVTRHIHKLGLQLEVRGKQTFSAAHYLGDTLTVYPYNPGTLEITKNQSALGVATHLHSTETTSWKPSPPITLRTTTKKALGFYDTDLMEIKP